jgi:hypothetical protein
LFHLLGKEPGLSRIPPIAVDVLPITLSDRRGVPSGPLTTHHSPTTCVLPQAVHIGAAAAEEEKLHVQVPEVDDLNTTYTSDPTIMATPGPEVSPRQ